jgi:tripartite-type tricarboxylate transporter receptor subunit TctC
MVQHRANETSKRLQSIRSVQTACGPFKGDMHLKKDIVIVFAILAASIVGVAAQTYPSRPITLIVPFAAGGQTDTITRAIAERMRESLGQPFIIENVAGAGGTIGVGRVARANPDGYTAVVGNWGTLVVTGAVYSLQYDLLTDFEPVALLATEPTVIVARKTLPTNNLRELIAWLKANPDKASIGASGVGGPSHIFAVSFQKETTTRLQIVPYRGAGPAIQDLVAGQIDMMITGPTILLNLVRAGSIKAYAVTAKTRLAAAPDIPTVDEAGLPGFYLHVWHGVWLPKGTPKDIVGKLNGAIVDALTNSTVRSRFVDFGQEIFPRDQQTPEALAAFHKAEIEKWWPIIKAAGIKAE